MTEEEFIEDVSYVCERPEFFTVTGTFFEAVSYLEGYGKGHGVVKFSHCIFMPFFNWLRPKYNIKGLNSGAVWNEFRSLFSTDEEAFKNLPILYGEYVYSSIRERK